MHEPDRFHDSRLRGRLALLAPKPLIGEPVISTDTWTVTIETEPCITLEKTAETTMTIGGTIYYEYLITNCGDVTLYNVELYDDQLEWITVPDTILSPQESTTATATYLVIVGDKPSVVTYHVT